jgi:predicted TIM-barrel fold metal-dependent hydrolase
MAAVTGLIFAGAPEKFPKLRIAALEACCGWVPFLMDRLDEEFEKRGAKEAPLLKRKPSEYMSGEQFFYAFELEESTVPYVIGRIGSDKLLYSSDILTGIAHGRRPCECFKNVKIFRLVISGRLHGRTRRTSTASKQCLKLTDFSGWVVSYL